MLLDTDVNANLIRYLRAVRFSVLFATKVKVNIRDDAAIVKWARRHNRILVCHDKYQNREHKIKVFQEIYAHGGHVIQIAGGSGQDILTSLGKLLANREEWVNFFKQNDGVALVHRGGMKPMPRQYLIRQIQGTLGGKTGIGDIPLRSPRRQRQPKIKPTSPNKPPLL
ncbi:MAG: hypothetical protein HY665_00355 [Chloroflexi bacterium]|nr:hypothetical protein [Chloroflexota bacterium]